VFTATLTLRDTRADALNGIPIFAKQGEQAFHEWLETTGV
jgi:hypothetical protein